MFQLKKICTRLGKRSNSSWSPALDEGQGPAPVVGHLLSTHQALGSILYTVTRPHWVKSKGIEECQEQQ